MFSFDFEYFIDGRDFTVEVDFTATTGIADPASDWDAKDHVVIDKVTVYNDYGDEVSVDIPSEKVYSEISAKIRDIMIAAEVEGDFDGNY